MEDLQLLQVGASVDRILKRGSDKGYDKRVHGGHGVFAGGLYAPDNASRSYEVTVQAVFPVKLLLRITSKKVDPRLLSFYFKLPTLERVLALNASHFFNLSEGNIQELPGLMRREEYIRILRELSDTKESTVSPTYAT